MPIDPRAVKELFGRLIAKPAGERKAYLARVIDPELRARLAALLRANDDPLSAVNVPLAVVKPERTSEYAASRPAPREARATSLVGQIVSGRYKLLEVIGEGGMGAVYMAQQTEPVKRQVAVKLIKAGMDSKQVLARFDAERQALALMDHPNIARIYDGGVSGNAPYVVMELVKGVPITKYCDRARLTPRQRLELIIPVCQAIQHAHQKGIIHRDIKPNNVLVAMYDDRPVPKVIDFGVAKARGQQLTEQTLATGFGAVVGTPEYMSPEQASFNQVDVDTRSDVYSLGVLIYELLTGAPPFPKEDLKVAGLLEMLRVIREQEPSKPSTKVSSTDKLPSLAALRSSEPKKLSALMKGEIDWIVLKSLEKDRTRRYETANGLGMDIQRYLDGEAVEAHPPSARYQLSKFVHRNWGRVVAASLVILASLLGMSASTYFAVRANERANEAATERGKTQVALDASQTNQKKTEIAEKEALRQAANSGCDVAQQLCEQNSVVQGLNEYARALKFANEAGDADLEDAIRWNLGAWANELHTLAYSIEIPSDRYASAAFNSEGTILAIGAKEAKAKAVIIRLRNAADGSPRAETLRIDGPTRVLCLTWLPDGKRLGIATDDGRFHLWKPGEETPSISFVVDEPGAYLEPAQHTQLAFNPDGTRLIASSKKSTIKIYDTATGEPTRTLDHEGRSWTTSVAWSRDGKLLLTGNLNGEIRIWDADTGKILGATVRGNSGLQAIAFAADSKSFVVGTGWGTPSVQVWDTASRSRIGPVMRHFENVYTVAFSPDGSRVIAGDGGNEAHLWEVGTSKPVGAPIWNGRAAHQVAFRPDGKAVLTISGWKTSVWNVGSGMRHWQNRSNTPDGAFLFSKDGSRILKTAGHEIESFDRRDGHRHSLLFRSDEYLRRLQLSPDGKTLYASSDAQVDRWDLTTNSIAATFRDVPATFIALDKDDERLLICDPWKGVVEMRNAKTGEVIRSVPKTEKTWGLYWMPNGRDFIAAASGGNPKIRDGRTGVAQAEVGRGCGAYSLSFHPDGRTLMAANSDYHVRFYEMTTWKEIGPQLPHPCHPRFTAYSKDGALALTSDSSIRTRLWHSRTGKRIGPVLPGEQPTVSPDNRDFAVRDGANMILYAMPKPRAGTVDEVAAWVLRYGGEYGTIPEPPPVLSPDAISVETARASIGKTLTVEMTVRSVGPKEPLEWMYLNSAADWKDADNFTVTIKYPTAERLKEMGLFGEIVGRRIRVAGKITRYRESPQLLVERTEQLRVLPPTAEDAP
jgi:eukaryotic-like serine/threonine-protein kinase